MNNIIRFLKSTGIYLVGNGLIKIILFFMLPIYTKYINPVDYGMYDVNITYISFLASILFFDIWNGIMRFMFDYSKNERYKPIYAGLIIFIFSSILYSIITFSIGKIFIKQYLGLVFLYGLFMNFQNVLGNIARGYGKNLLYMVAGIVGTLTMVVFNIVFLVFLKWGYASLYISSIFSYIINILIILVGIKEKLISSSFYLDKSLLKNMFLFSLPLSLNSVAYWFLSSYNRVVITNTLGSYENGLYAIAIKFGAIINLVIQCFQLSLQEMTFEKAGSNEKGKSEYYSKIINEYIKFLLIGVLCVLPFVRIIYSYMIDKEYYDAINIVPLYLIATIVSAVSSYLGAVFGAIKNNKQIFISTVIGSVCNVISIHLLIDKIGLQSANVALIIGFLVNVIFRVLVLKRNIKIKVNFLTIITLIVLVIFQIVIYVLCNLLLNIAALVLAIFIAIMCYRKIIIGFLS